MHKPTIHLNGTSPEDLLNGYTDARSAVEDAITKIKHAYPNGRDYYPQGPGVIYQAQEEHYARIAKLKAVSEELLELAIHCSDAIAERSARRAG